MLKLRPRDFFSADVNLLRMGNCLGVYSVGSYKASGLPRRISVSTGTLGFLVVNRSFNLPTRVLGSGGGVGLVISFYVEFYPFAFLSKRGD